MPIKCTTPPEQIYRYIVEKVERLKTAIIYNLSFIGEQVLNAARSTNSYKDQTGNLRSSLGYIISVDGDIVQMSDFQAVKEGIEGSKGGKEYALQLVQEFPNGIVLIVVAGMNYASYVSAKGYDVIDSAELLAEKLVPQMLSNLGLK